jgi:hypothetical protein
MLPTSAMQPRRLSRPSAPSCRGGASSLLRLAQTGSRSGDFSGWVQRAAAVLAPATPRADAVPSIITPLRPSRAFAAAVAAQ